MNETTTNPTPEQPEKPKQNIPEIDYIQREAMTKIQVLAAEHFDDYLIVLSRGKQTWHVFKTCPGAFGMATMIAQEISQHWTTENVKK